MCAVEEEKGWAIPASAISCGSRFRGARIIARMAGARSEGGPSAVALFGHRAQTPSVPNTHIALLKKPTPFLGRTGGTNKLLKATVSLAERAYLCGI